LPSSPSLLSFSPARANDLIANAAEAESAAASPGPTAAARRQGKKGNTVHLVFVQPNSSTLPTQEQEQEHPEPARLAQAQGLQPMVQVMPFNDSVQLRGWIDPSSFVFLLPLGHEPSILLAFSSILWHSLGIL
jgi:hypothetical protein